MKAIFKQPKIVWILVAIIIAISTLSLYVIHGKSKIEQEVNSEYFMEYYPKFISEKSELEAVFTIIERSINGEQITERELEMNLTNVGYFHNAITDIEAFYNRHYGEIDYIIIDSGYEDLRMFISTIMPGKYMYINVGGDKYELKESYREKYIDEFYVIEKITAIREIIEDFREKNRKYVENVESEGVGKRFVKEGEWIELHEDIYSALREIELSYNIGDKAPQNSIIPKDEGIGYHHRLFVRAQQGRARRYTLIDTEEGIYFAAATSITVETLYIESIEKIDGEIVITMKEKKYYDDRRNDNGGFELYRCLLRGLKPGDSEKYDFKVINSEGKEYEYENVGV